MSLILFLSPYLRSSAVWITTDNLGIIFFALSISKYLNIKKNTLKNILLCFTYLSIATYTRQYYVIFFLFYFVKLFRYCNYKNIFIIIFYLSILFIPYLIYYYFFLKQNLPSTFELAASNYPFKFALISNLFIFLSLYFFYTMPFYINSDLKRINNNIKYLFFYLIIFLIFFSIGILNPVYINNYGGGIFYKIAEITNINQIFYFSAFLGFLLLSFNFNKNNLMIYLCIILSFPVAIIYQKYFDPLLILVLTTLT